MFLIRKLALIFVLLLVIPCCAAEKGGEVTGRFLEHLKAKRYTEAVAFFSDELRFLCSEQELRTVMSRITNDDVHISGKQRDRGNRKISGQLQSFDAVEKRGYPNGVLYESILRFENSVLRSRFAVVADKITAFEFLAIPNEPVSDHGLRCFNSTEIGKILGFDHSITVELFDDNGNKIDINQYNNVQGLMYQKINSLPNEQREPWYWTNPKDGTHWHIIGNSIYADFKTKTWKENICRLTALEKGTYRFFTNLQNSKNPDAPKGMIFSEPITVDENHKNQKITLRLIRGGTLKIHYRDTETGELIDETKFRSVSLKCDLCPQGLVFNPYFPGRYTFSITSYPQTPEDRVYTPTEEKYEAEIIGGKETIVEVKLRSRPQTEEELNKRWNYIVTGTVRDTEGKPLDGATITVRRSGIMERGLYRAGYRKTKSDVTGRFTLRFNPNDLDAVNSLEKKSNATPEKPDVYGFRIEAKRAGFVWGGIRLDDGKIVANQFLDDNNQRIDHYDMVGMEPKPSDLSNVKSQFKMTPDNVFYALEPKNIEMVMQPAVEIFGAIKFDPQPDGTPKEPDKKAGLFYKKSYISLIFDMPVKDGKNNEQLPEFWDESEYPDYSFNIDALPKEVSAFLRAAQISVPESWKNDQVLIETDSFQLPPAGKYETELRWQTIEKHGTKIHKLNIDSLTDSTGQKFDLQFVKKNEPNEILFNRWSFTGILRDDIGNPIDDAEVRLYRYNRRVGSNFETLKTDAEGKFTTSEIKPYLLTKKDYDRDLLHGEFLAVQFNKDGFLQKEQVIDDDAQLIFLSDIENPHEKTFFNGTLSTERIVEARKSTEFNFVLPRCPIIEGVLVDSDDKPLTGYKLILSADAEFESDFRPYIQTDREGHFVVNKILPKLPFWFQLLDDHNEQDIFRTNNIVFESGKKYEVKLRLRKEPDNSRRLILESVRNSIGVDITAEIVTEDLRTRPLLGKEETKKGREILQKTEKAVRPMLLIEEREIESIEYSFHLGDKVTEYNAKPYHHDYNYLNKPSNLTLGISFESPLNWIFEATQKIHFRNINIDENEIRILTTLQGWYTFGNGISETWNGYVHAGFDGAEFILDTKTSLPKRIITSRSQTEYFDWTPFGNPQNGQFVPKRILCKTGGMTFDFRFKILDQTVWFFDRSVLSDENGEKTICHIENIRINPIKWASEEDESRVRDVLRKYNDANRYWLTLYPKDLPKFGYTFHRRGADDEVLSYETIKAATNWYAEFYRKGISYIGVSRLLVIDIDALRCTRVVENTDAGTLEFDFVLKHAWMNAFGNGIANTWLGWSNSVINRGTAIFDTKTNTVKEIRTETYDERFFDYYELKPGQFVPRRIVIDFSKGKGSNADLMFYDFRFKIYEPCLWLFDRSVEPDKKDFPVWIDNVIVEGKPGTERK